MESGEVVAGQYAGAQVRKATFGSELVVQTGIRGRRLTVAEVAEWAETDAFAETSAVTSVVQAVAKAVVPRQLRNAASAALDATVSSGTTIWHSVRVDWIDGAQSLIRLPADLFAHFELMLEDRRSADAAPIPRPTTVAVSVQDPPNIADHAFALAANVLDKIPNRVERADAAEQLQALASLRDAGVLTDEEFATKKSEILGRL